MIRGLTPHDPVYGGHQLVYRAVLQQVTAGSGLESPGDVVIVGAHRKDEDVSARQELLYLAGGKDAVHPGRVDVHYHQ